MRVVIAEDDPITRLDLKKLLEQAGVEILGEGKDGIDAVSLCAKYSPDVAIMDINMPSLDGLNAAKILYRDKLCKAVVLLTAYSDYEYIESAKEIGVQGYLVKPLNVRSLVSTLEIALASAIKTEDLQEKVDKITKKMEDRKLIDRAKTYLMETEGLTEDEAYRKIRNLSMQKNCSMRVISEIFLLSKERSLL